MRSFKNILVWQKSKSLVAKIYILTSSFPDSERFGLTSQIRRAAISIPSNIAEGCSRSSDKDFKRFLEIAIGSSFELETQLLIATDLNYLNETYLGDILTEITEIQKMLNSFIQKLKANG
ncbi:MAG: four helix bundle protein [Cyclobacteriaceae bacterium]